MLCKIKFNAFIGATGFVEKPVIFFFSLLLSRHQGSPADYIPVDCFAGDFYESARFRTNNKLNEQKIRSRMYVNMCV